MPDIPRIIQFSSVFRTKETIFKPWSSAAAWYLNAITCCYLKMHSGVQLPETQPRVGFVARNPTQFADADPDSQKNLISTFHLESSILPFPLNHSSLLHRYLCAHLPEKWNHLFIPMFGHHLVFGWVFNTQGRGVTLTTFNLILIDMGHSSDERKKLKNCRITPCVCRLKTGLLIRKMR